MIQAARSSKSRSFLREAKDCVLVMPRQKDVLYFQTLIDEVVQNRADNKPYSGAKAVREQLLACLSRYGEVKTANIWCRGLIVEIEAINELRAKIGEELAKRDIYGVLEIHLQDREINSSHLQFVGIRAEEAEQIIAQIVVDLRYEISLQSAMSKGAEPYYKIDSAARTLSLTEQLSFEEREREARAIKEAGVSFFEQMRQKREEFAKTLDELSSSFMAKIEATDFKKRQKSYNDNRPISERVSDLNERIKRWKQR